MPFNDRNYCNFYFGYVSSGCVYGDSYAIIIYCTNHYPYKSVFITTLITGTSKLDVLIPSLTVSLLVFALLMFLFGILFGFLLIKCIPKPPKENMEQIPGSVPLYEDIKLPSVLMDQDFMKFKDNEAYSHI